MEQSRLLIAIVLSILIFVLWQFFFVDKDAVQKSAKKAEQTPAKEEQIKATEPIPEEKAISEPETPAVATADDKTPQRIPQTITVDTPLYQIVLSEKGAGFTSFLLKKYRENVSYDSPLKELLPKTNALESLLLGFAGKSLPELDNAVYSTNLTERSINITDGPRAITLEWNSPQGVTVEKTYKFSPDTYVIGLDVTIINRSAQSIQDKLFVSLAGLVPQDSRAYGFEGPSTLIGDKVEEVKIKDIAEKSTYPGRIKWVALQDRYFVMSLIPLPAEETSMRLSLKNNDQIEAQHIRPESVIRPGTQQQYQYQLFFGPKSMKTLGEAGHDLSKAVNFGWFDFIAKPCVWLMNLFYSVIPNYGIAIIILTILTKILLWPLGSKSYKSMSEMKKIQPLMKEIREKYKNDKKKMNEEVMSLYRTYKINPLGGCLPMVVQIPVFFALYRMLYQAIELRHAPFFLWIDDLSAPDRLFRFDFAIPFMEPPYGIPVLTIIMGGTMLLQQKMSPPMGDPTQAKMMMLMPVVFTIILINFSSGLVLYWLVNNVLSIGQQYYIQKKFA
jgi:YidC/Oxa1 family membrane protein insertase